MTYSRLILASIICLFSAGCRPPETNVAEQSTTKETLTALPREELPEISSETRHFTLLTGPWSKYISVPPKIYTFDKISSGIETLLTTEQKLIQAVLEADVNVAETSAHGALNDRLDELKAAVPSAETRSGYVRSNSKSSSPELVRSVSGLAANASLTTKDLDQRITALQHLNSTWTRRTAVMGTNATAGIMRDANEAYLDGLRQYTSDFIQLRKELRIIKSEQSKRAANKSNIIAEWNQFEQQNLHILNKFLHDNHTAIIDPTKGADYLINKDKLNGTLILVCNIGPRQLYFELNGRNPFHPFTLADITPTNQ